MIDDNQEAVALRLALGISVLPEELGHFLKSHGYDEAAKVARQQKPKLEGPTPNIYDRLSAGKSEMAVIPEGAFGHLDGRTARERAEDRNRPSRSDAVRRGVDEHYDVKDCLEKRFKAG
jgi:hypothetical protein